MILCILALILIFTLWEQIYYNLIFDTKIINNPENYITSINYEKEKLGEALITPEEIELKTTYTGERIFITKAFVNFELEKYF